MAMIVARISDGTGPQPKASGTARSRISQAGSPTALPRATRPVQRSARSKAASYSSSGPLIPGKRRGRSEGISLLAPWVRAVGVAVVLPEAEAVADDDLEPAQPLRALPEVEARHQQAERPAVLRVELAAVVAVGEQRIVVHHGPERHVRRVVLLAVGHDVGGVRQQARGPEHVGDRDALPDR